MSIDSLFEDVREALNDALLISWDQCHKIYLAMDEHEANWFTENYPVNFTGTPDEMYQRILEWWDDSCGLKFVNAVYHKPLDPNSGFVSLIPQFSEWDEEEEIEVDDEQVEIDT